MPTCGFCSLWPLLARIRPPLLSGFSQNVDLTATPSRRRFLFAALYLCEGGPIGFIWWALPTRLREAGVPIETITALTSVVVLPWLLKFFWAPAVDVARSRRWGHRHWIMSCQLVMGLTLLPVAFLDYRADLSLLYVLLPVHAAAAATQDVAIDAWAIRITPGNERGRLTAAMQMGMLMGRWLFGAGVLLAGEGFGDTFVIAALVGVVWVTALLVFVSRDPAPREASAERWRAFVSSLTRVFAARNTWLGLGLAGLGGAGFEAVGAVMGPFLIDRGFSSTTVGHVYTGSVVTMLAGAVAGGWAADRFGRRGSTAAFLVFLAAVIVVLAGFDAALPTEASRAPVVASLLAVYLGIGLFTAASYALFMDLTDPRLAGTQFSAYMGGTNACESWSALAAGRLVAASGYAIAFAAMAGLSLLALPLLALTSLQPSRPDEESTPGPPPLPEPRQGSEPS